MSSSMPLIKRPVTQKHIAEHCNLSLMTVSRILRKDQEMFKAETVKRVLEAAEALGYDPSQTINARRLRYAKDADNPVENKLVAMYFSLHQAESQYFYRLLSGISKELYQEGYCLLTNWSSLNNETVGPIPAIFNRGEVDGVLTLSGTPLIDQVIVKLRSIPGFSTKPIVTMMEQEKDGCCVLVDDRSGGEAAMEHLIDLGHKEVIHVVFSKWQHQERIAGCEQACKAKGFDPAQVLHPMISDDHNETPSRESLFDTLKRFPTCKAIFSGNDHTAILISQWLKEEGIQVGEDMSLVGFDDTHSLPDSQGQNMLTTIHIPLEDVARRASRMLIERIRNKIPTGEKLTLPVKLVVRGSATRYQ